MAGREAPKKKPSVVFVCVANSFRSQMAEGAARARVRDRWEIWSAGSHPSGVVHPRAIQSMAEVGVDLRGQRSKGLADLPVREWDLVVTMGCGDACPMLRAKRRLDWDLPDPDLQGDDGIRRVRDRILALVEELCRESDSAG
ncbi:MAG TPA: arsenate reductase ArsC [bacterium]